MSDSLDRPLFGSEWWRITLSSIGDAVIATDVAGRVVFMNDVAETLTRWSQAEALGRPLTDIFIIVNESTRVRIDDPVAKVLQTGAIVGLANHTVLINREGQDVPIDDSAAPILNERRHFSGVVLIFRDISERRRIEAAQRYLAAIVESSDDAIVGKTLDGVITSWNRGAQRIFGYTPEEAIGSSITMIIPAERLTEESDIVARLRRGERIDHFETIRVAKDGSRINISLTVSPIRSSTGTVIGASKIARDITTRKRLEEQLQFLSHLIRELSLVVGPNDIVRIACRRTGEYLGASSCHFSELETGADSRIIVHPGWSREDMPRPAGEYQLSDFLPNEVKQDLTSEGLTIEDVREDAFTRDRLASYELLKIRSFANSSFVREENRVVILSVTHENPRRWRADERALLGTVAAQVWPLVERARLEQERARWLEREQSERQTAEKANRLKDEFLATLSHELRTPLNSILGWATLLRTGKITGEKAADAIATIERNARTQAHLIDDLLDVSRIITGKLRLELRPVIPAAVVESALAAVKPMANAKGVRLQWKREADAGPIAADAGRLQQVVWNLLTNAIKFTPRGGRVKVSVRRVNSQVEIAFSDTGRGIDPLFLPDVFDRFRQAESATTREHGGLGLGLDIVRRLVELHGGQVEAASPGLDKGATFTVRLPIMITSRKRSLKKSDSSKPRRKTAAFYERPPRLDGVKVLIIDDEEDARKFVRTVLEGAGAKVREAVSVAKGLHEAKVWKPSIILSDVGMPNEDGYEFIKKFRIWEKEYGASTPAVALTAYARSEDRRLALAAGFQIHLAKPIHPDELLSVVATEVGRR